MAKLTATQVQSYARTAAANKKYSDGNGLYFCVRKSGMPYWMLRYTSLNGRREATLGQYPSMTLAEARLESPKMQLQLQQGEDPLAIRAIETIPEIQNVSQLFQDWYTKDLSRRLKHPNIPKRVFTKEIAPVIGQLPITTSLAASFWC